MTSLFSLKSIKLIGGAASLSLLISCGYPTLAPRAPQSSAQAQSAPTSMTLAKLETILNEADGSLQGSAGQWRLTIGNRPVFVLADASNDRMRIFTPVVPATELSPEQVQSVLLANFHTALDARYALSDDALVAAFVHPLASLNDNDLRSALSQVATLADNFGTTYSSGALDFGPSGPANANDPEQLAI
ncbi:MAG: type III secretion system chaperone [Cyanobacteria bacterium J06598_1]